MMRQPDSQRVIATTRVAQVDGGADKMFLVKIFWGLTVAMLIAGIQMALLLWQ